MGACGMKRKWEVSMHNWILDIRFARHICPFQTRWFILSFVLRHKLTL